MGVGVVILVLNNGRSMPQAKMLEVIVSLTCSIPAKQHDRDLLGMS